MSIPAYILYISFKLLIALCRRASQLSNVSVIIILSNANALYHWTERLYTLTSFCVLTRLIHFTGTLTISHNVHCSDSEVDVGPQVWKHVLPQVT